MFDYCIRKYQSSPTLRPKTCHCITMQWKHIARSIWRRVCIMLFAWPHNSLSWVLIRLAINWHACPLNDISIQSDRILTYIDLNVLLSKNQLNHKQIWNLISPSCMHIGMQPIYAWAVHTTKVSISIQAGQTGIILANETTLSML